MSDDNVTVFMQFLISCMLNVQRKNVPKNFLDTFGERLCEILFEGVPAHVILIQAA